MTPTSGVSLGIASRDAAVVAEASGVLERGTTVNVGFIDGEGRDARLAAVRAVVRAGLVPVAHLSARRLASEGELAEYLRLLRESAAGSHVFVVGGDPAVPAGLYANALDVIRSRVLEHHGAASVSLGGYPEGHPVIPEPALWAALQEKAAVLEEQGRAGEIITQVALDPDAVLAWIARVRDRGIALPIRVGVAGPVLTGELLGLAKSFGARADHVVAKRYGLGAADTVATASRFVDVLASRADPATHGEVGLHVFTFGSLVRTTEWIAGLG
ncbi:methylenetetrahydrofolate reductase [Herbiconiux sp.]|uniref:methylenetetrahydrofolate reductase n=1 Tax=Herbiconiux sp. TaxID=1871186 RepID=UPI0025B9D127|nr:methylenetetrahydrofolate reductase [Herbiconiux sp.]